MANMVRTKSWSYSEEKFLLENYKDLTIKELEQKFPNRSRESIYNKIKRLKRTGKLKEGIDEETRKRSYSQRSKNIEE
jgi:hypothetical protein